MLKTDYNIPIFEDTDAADLNKYSNEMANALKTQINNTNNEIKEIDKKVVDAVNKFTEPLNYKGQVSTIQDLPTNATNGDIHSVTSENKNYIYNGTNWVEYSSTLDLTYLENNTKTTQTTEISESLTIENCAPVSAKLDIVSGKSIQEGEPSSDNIIPIRNVGDNINLIKLEDVAETTNAKGITYSFKDGVFTLNGTSTGSHYINNKNNNYNLKAGTYTISPEIISGSYTGVVGKQINIDSTTMWANLGNIDDTKTFTTTTDVVNGYNSFYIGSNAVFNNLKIRFKLNKGSIPTPYTPYNCGSADFQLSNADNSQSRIVSFPFTEGQVLHKGDYLASDGIHQVRKKMMIDISKFTVTVTSSGLLILSSASAGIIWDYKNINGVCSHFKNANNNSINANSQADTNLKDGEYNFRAGDTRDRIYFKNRAFTTKDQWTDFFNNNEVMLEYEPNEEIVIPYTTEQEEAYYELQHLLMYEGYTNIECIDEIKPDIQLTYWYNNELNNSYGERFDKVEDKINELEKVEKGEIYSKEEQVIGKWTNGKPLYRKIIDFGTLPNATERGVKHEISNLQNNIINVNVIVNGENSIPIPYASPTSIAENITYRISGTYFTIITGSDRSNLNAKVILEYTKTTD